jgi:tetratricopeptide (TPR) repeat protein
MVKLLILLICFSGYSKSAHKIEALKEIREATVDFYKASHEFVSEIESIAANERYLDKLDVEDQYESKAENISVLEDANRKLSIRLFHKYISKYPESRFIQDVLYRLGQLYFEDSAEKLIRDTEAYETEYKKFIVGELQVLPSEPIVDYTNSIAVLKRLIRDYKDYRFRDRALYLLGYAYFEEGKIEQSIVVFDQLVSEFPKSEKLPEVYTRLGEFYFDTDNFSKAVYYYSHVLEYPDSAYYDKVLYKLAWSYYRKKKNY